MNDAGAQADPWLREFLDRHRLPESYTEVATAYFEPLASLVHDQAMRKEATLLVAVNGSQGSGKSTLCDYLVECLAARYKLRAIALSLDDFYLTKAGRQRLATDVHPLLATRGVPGTHDTQLLADTLNALQAPESSVTVPRFDKSVDDRFERSNWSEIDAPVDVVLLEGWCMGACGDDAQTLARPLNSLEADEDAEGVWRRYTDKSLREAYAPIFARMDLWVMLCAPGFEQVLRWRTEQEEKLRAAVAGRGDGLMDDAALARFVAHYERHTRQCLRQLPEDVDVLLRLDSERRIVESRGLPQVS
ncbi:MAG: hypothetical protein AAGG55_14790 [Pseudomonadota bacterium]